MEFITETMPLGDMNALLADEAAKRLNLKPSEVQFVRKGLIVENKGTDEDERSSKELIATENKDRDGEMMLNKGVVLEWYQSNPLVLFAHNYQAPPIGRNAWIKRDNKNRGLLAKTIYATTAFAEEIWQLVKGGFLPGRSVGFIPLEQHQPTEAEIKENPERKDVMRIYDKWELLEYSVVPVPSNRQALVQAIGKSLPEKFSPELIYELGIGGLKAEPPGEEWPNQKPFPEEHSCRILNPDSCDKFRRANCDQKSDGKCIDVIYGHSKSDDKWDIQALRYPKDVWTAEAASNHCKGREGSFEAAKPERCVQPTRIIIPTGRFVQRARVAPKIIPDNSLDIAEKIARMVKQEVNRKRGRV